MKSLKYALIHRCFAYFLTLFVMYWLSRAGWALWIDAAVLNVGLFTLAWAFFETYGHKN